jgi:hypothetical protein
MSQITQEYLLKTFLYKDGILIWKNSRPKINAGSIAGTINDNGYIIVGLNRKRYKAHILIWMLHYGVWPNKLIDHINGIKCDNRIENLREATKSQNEQNKAKSIRNTSGFKNVFYHPSTGKYRVRINKISFGLYLTAEEANQAAIFYRKKLYGEFNNNH